MLTPNEWTDGEYPTEATLERLRAWPVSNTMGEEALAFMRSIWWSADWGWTEYDGADRLLRRRQRIYQISTGGWSGNESLIDAMKSNTMLWCAAWHASRRGGHYEFRADLGPLAKLEGT